MKFRKIATATSGAAIALLSLSPLTARQVFALDVHNVSKAVSLANDLGHVEPNKSQTLTIVLKKHNEAELDKAIEELYNPESSTYHQWFTAKDFVKYAPTSAEMETVKKELLSHGLKVISTDPQNFSLRVTGTTADVEEAFQTELHSLRYNNKVFQAHTRDAQLTGAAGDLVDSVVGIDRHKVRPQVTIAQNPATGKPLFKKKITAASANATLLSAITGTPLTAPALYEFTTPGAALPLGVYYGNVYSQNPNLIVSYTPAQLQSHYGLTSLIKEGYDGTGQTIALVEGYGYAYAEADANVAAKAFGLPALTSSNFAQIYPEGKPLNPQAADLEGWTTEIALDVQSAHAIAPGAKILVVASSGQDNEDQIASLEYVISHKLANVISNSWENDDEIVAGSAEENAFNAVLKLGSAAGVSIQFSSGDSGDLGLGTPVGAVGVPSNSPYATAVGGTSILNNTAGTGQVVTGWGNDITYLNLFGPTDPPTSYGFFYAGAGGGESEFFSKPAYQKSLPGTGRQVPDVSALADPFTGFEIVVTSEGVQSAIAGIGGTSLASPLFTGIWAIADQYNGKSLGQAGPAVAKLKAGQITDVLPTSDLNVSDVSGTVYDSNGPTFYSQTGLFSGLLYSQSQFVSAIWPILPGEEDIAITFGTDSSLTVTPGWDNVTGYGEPNGLPFIQGVTGKTKGAAIIK